MDLYFVTKNTGPTWTGSDPLWLKYVGPSEDEAMEAVGDFRRYARPFPENYTVSVHTIVPSTLNPEMIRWFMADGWWYSIVKVNFEEECTGRPDCRGETHYLNCHIWFSMLGHTNFVAKKFDGDVCVFCRNGEYHSVNAHLAATKHPKAFDQGES